MLGYALFSGEAVHVQGKAGLASHVAAEDELLRGLAVLQGRAILVANVRVTPLTSAGHR